jgi:predicted enzyme related to lactoylglutathione lyase
MPDTGTAANVRFAPRRLAHANIFVGDLEKAVAFYTRIGGVEATATPITTSA